MKKRTLALGVFLIAFLMLLGISYYALATHDVLPTLFDKPVSVDENDKNLYPVLNAEGGWDYIDAAGTVVIAGGYDEAGMFFGEAAWVRKANSWALIDREGRLLTDWDYSEVVALDDGRPGLTVAHSGNVHSMFDADGNKLFGIEGELGSYDGGLIAFGRAKGEELLWGFIDGAGQIVIAPKYAAVGAVGATHALAQTTDGAVVLINRADGTELPLAEGTGLYGLGSNRLPFCDPENGNLWGYLNMEGHEAIAPQFAYAEAFSNGVALVADANGKHGLINDQGEWVMAPGYYNGRSIGNNYYLFSDGIFDFILVDKNGTQLCDGVVSYGEWLAGKITLQTKLGTRFLSVDGELTKPETFIGDAFSFGTLIGVQAESGSFYYNNAGEEIYASAGTELSGGYRMVSEMQADDAYLQLRYPMIVDKNGEETEDKYAAVNDRLRDNAFEDYDQTYLEAAGSPNFLLRGDYSVEICGSVVTVLQNNDVIAYHGQTVRSSLCFDRETGRQYNLSALFADDFNWRTDLAPYLQQAVMASDVIHESLREDLLAETAERLSRDTAFVLGEKGLTVYLPLYDGDIPVLLSYQDLSEVLDKEVSLYRALNLGL